jgi:hypothetical protein
MKFLDYSIKKYMKMDKIQNKGHQKRHESKYFTRKTMEIQDTMVSNVGCEYIIGFF